MHVLDGATTAAQDVEGSCSGLVETPSVTKKARISPQKQEGQLEEATDGEKKIANEPAGDAVDTDDTPVIVGVDDSENNADDEDEEEGEDDDEVIINLFNFGITLMATARNEMICFYFSHQIN